LSTPPDFSEHRTLLHAASDNAATNNRDAYMDADTRRAERRRRPPPTSPDEYLYALPALILLARIPIPMLATGLDGVVVYTNPAFATMLGHHPDTVMLVGQSLPALLAGRSATPAHECVAGLRAAGNAVVDRLPVEGFPVRSVVSDTLLFCATD
jgi:PAS domain-containing protein